MILAISAAAICDYSMSIGQDFWTAKKNTLRDAASPTSPAMAVTLLIPASSNFLTRELLLRARPKTWFDGSLASFSRKAN